MDQLNTNRNIQKTYNKLTFFTTVGWHQYHQWTTHLQHESVDAMSFRNKSAAWHLERKQCTTTFGSIMDYNQQQRSRALSTKLPAHAHDEPRAATNRAPASPVAVAIFSRVGAPQPSRCSATSARQVKAPKRARSGAFLSDSGLRSSCTTWRRHRQGFKKCSNCFNNLQPHNAPA